MTDPPPPSATMDTAEAAHYLWEHGGVFVSQESLQRWALSGKLPGSLKLPNRQWRHSIVDLDAILDRAAKTAAAALES